MMKKETNSAQNANRSAKRKPTKSKRASNIWNMQCPKCGSDEGIAIEMTVWGELIPHGIKLDNYRRTWSIESKCYCNRCNHIGIVREFRTDADSLGRVTEFCAEGF
jgi:hypothetical protein